MRSVNNGTLDGPERQRVYPTLAEVLELPVLQAAAPLVRAGASGLDAPVRWVHVSEQRDPAGTLTGGELVLSIGVAAADPRTSPAAYVAALQDAGAVGLVIELGQHLWALPTALVEAARAARFPLVELSRAVRFVEVTEVVHTQILNTQYARLQFTQRVSDTFRTLVVESGGVSRVLAEAAALTGMPVVLEDLGHRALSFAGEFPTATLLQALLHSTSLDEPALRARARALGLPTSGALTVVVVGGTSASADYSERELVEAAVAAARTVRAPAVVGRLTPGRVALIVSCRSAQSEADTVERIVGLLPDDSVALAAAAGPVTTFSGLGGAVAEAAFVADVAAATQGPAGARVWRSADLGAPGLLWQLRGDPRLLSYVDAQLRPVLCLDERARTQALETLSAYLEAGGGMTAFAAAIGLSRPAAYARLGRLRQVLGRDLDAPVTRLSLHLALLALHQRPDEAWTTPPAVSAPRPSRRV
jgi:purine catabolism regulator